MVAKKKKTKPAANPARGFATTSIASKPKGDVKADVSSSNQDSGRDSPSNAPSVAASAPAESTKDHTPSSAVAASKELHELSPEELEAQLTLSDLQNVIEQLGPKVKKEASRQVTRLQTDRRVLRSQADLLTVREWLPDELMLHIIDLAMEEERLNAANGSPNSLKRFNEDDLLAKIWQLKLSLTDLDISEEQVHKALQYILTNPPAEETGNFIWGLPETLDWLAVHSDPGELLDYDTQRAKPQSAVPLSNPAESEDNESLGDWKASKRVEEAVQAKSQTVVAVVDDIEVSDVDSDMDPDEMVSTYLRTKARLFHRNPDLVSEPIVKGNKKSKKLQVKPASPSAKATPGEAKLQQRLKKIESDALFDQYTADVKWLEQRNELAQERAERRKLRLDEERRDTPQAGASPSVGPVEKPTESSATDDIMAEAEREAQKLLEEMNEDDGLAGMFGEPSEPISGDKNSDGANSDNVAVTIRQFGKTTGISPRRVFEDACRSRDPGAKVQYKMVSATTYAARHSAIVSWSKDQEILESASLPDITIQSSSRKTIITMASVACTDTTQSEGYVSTVALFLLFSNSPKEEKSALRLPPVFRDLWQEFKGSRQEKRDAADRTTVESLREMIRHQTEQEAEEDVVLTAGFKNRQKGLSGISTPIDGEQRDGKKGVEESQVLKDMWIRKSSSPSYQHMLQSRMNLPMYQFRDVALEAIDKNPVTILCGETGCGKSTQLPAFILEHELSRGRSCKIYCTEPRRISAISLAQRVSEEMGDDKGAVGTSRSLVGYSIRLESHTTAQTRLIYATVGIVLRMLESAKGIDDVTHLVIDEIHERSIDTDFLLIVLQSLMLRRPDLKVVLMSATVDAQRFSSYLGNAPIVTVPGRTFPVEAKFLEDAIEITGHTIEGGNHRRTAAEDEDDELERPADGTSGATQQLVGYSPKTIRTLSEYDEYAIDYELIVKLLGQVAYNQIYSRFSQAILVFLPGLAEIRQLNDMLLGNPAFSQGWLVYPLHSSFSSEDQQAAFKVPPWGMRKIVLATNIAETGITIPDVTCVIDTGKHKEMRFDERRQLSRLIQSFISRANAKQRRGRAGRVQEGICFHLFTKYRHDHIMAESQTPEMLRLSLQDLVMRVKICKLGDIEQALSQALDPPSLKNIRRAIDALIDVDALTQNEELTPLGQQLAKLPLDAQLGKLILLASIFNCLDFALTTAAILSSKSPFLSPINAKKQADTVRLGYKRGNSDLLTAYNAYSTWKKICQTSGQSEFQFCKKNFLSPQNLSNIEDLKGQLLSSLVDAGFVSLDASEKQALGRVRGTSGRQRNFVQVPDSWNKHVENDLLLNSVTAWSFYPKVLQRDGKGWRNIANNQSISLHPTSVNKGGVDAKYLSFYSIMQSASRFTNAQETSPVEAMALVLLAGDARFDMYSGVIIIDGNRLRLKVSSWRTMIVLKMLRTRIKDVLAKTLKSPGRVLGDRQREWMEIFEGIFERVDKDRRLGKV